MGSETQISPENAERIIAEALGANKLFEWEAGYEPAYTANPGSWLTLSNFNFATPFTEPPIVFIRMHDAVTVLPEHYIMDVTKIGFSINGPAYTGGFSWFACTPGKFDIGNGVTVHTGMGTKEVSTDNGWISADIPELRQDFIPPVLTQLYNTWSVAPSPIGVLGTIQGRAHKGDAGAQGTYLNQSLLNVAYDSAGSSDTVAFFVVTPTSKIVRGVSPILTDAKGIFGTTPYEACQLSGADTVSPNAAVQWNTAFLNPIIALQQAETRSLFGTFKYVIGKSQAGISTLSMLFNGNDVTGTENTAGIFAIEIGHGSIANARRLG